MSATLTTLDSLLKNVYLPGLPNFVNTQRPLWGRLSKITDKKRFSGRQFIFAGKAANPQGTGAIGEGDTLPVPGNTAIDNMQMAVKYYYGVAQLSAQVMAAADSNEGAFARAVQTELDGVRDQVIEDMAIASVYGDGSGARGIVSAYSSSTLTLQDQPNVGQNGVRMLRKNMFLSSFTAKSGGSQGADNKQISAIPTTATATVPTSAGFSASDYVFRNTGQAGYDPRNKDMMGLGGIVDDGSRLGSIQNLSRTTFPEMKANRLGNSGTLRAWTPDLMDAAGAQSFLNGGGQPVSAIYSPWEIQQRAAAYLRSDRRYDMSVKKLDGGYSAVMWTTKDGELPWFVDRYAIPNEVHFVRESDLFLAILEDIQFENRDGGMWRYTGRTHQPEAWLYTFRNMGAYQFNNHTALVDVSHTL